MQLHITHIHGQLGITRHDAVLSIRQPKADLKMHVTDPKVNMRTEHVRVKIDQTRCFSEAGLKGILELNRELARRAKDAVLEAIAVIVEEGNQMARIENKTNAIAEIAAEKTYPPPLEFNIDFIPKSRPKIDFEGGKVYFAPVMGKVHFQVKINPPEISVTSPSIDIFWLRRPYFHFEFTGDNVDLRV